MTPVLCLHGFTGGASSFDRVRASLPPSARVSAPPLVGHGAPPAAMDVATFDGEVDRLAAMLGNDEPAIVVGYSLGARLGVGLLARHPERVRALIAISGSAGLPNEVERAERRRRDARLIELLERQGLEAFLRVWEAQPLFDTQRSLPDAVRHEERSRRSAHTAAGLAHSLRATGLAEMPDYVGALTRIERPVELLCGELDSKFCRIASDLAERLRGARVTRVPGAGHNLLLERAGVVSDAILRAFPA